MVTCGTYLNNDEYVDSLVEFYLMFIKLEFMGFLSLLHILCLFYGCSLVLTHV